MCHGLLDHYELVHCEGPALVETVVDGLGLRVGQAALLRPGPADSVVDVERVEGVNLPNAEPSHDLGNLLPHETEPIALLLETLVRAEVIPLKLELGLLASSTEESGLRSEARWAPANRDPASFRPSLAELFTGSSSLSFLDSALGCSVGLPAGSQKDLKLTKSTVESSALPISSHRASGSEHLHRGTQDSGGGVPLVRADHKMGGRA